MAQHPASDAAHHDDHHDEPATGIKRWLFATNHKALAPHTAYFVGLLIAIYYTFEAPLSGMSTNPARTFGSAVHANDWHSLWIYFIAPSMGMLAASEVFLRIRGGAAPYCAKLHHANNERCIFHHAQNEV